jgi:hypothetical protein
MCRAAIHLSHKEPSLVDQVSSTLVWRLVKKLSQFSPTPSSAPLAF